jgi:hypothetical protein
LENSTILLLWLGTLGILWASSQTYRLIRRCRPSTRLEISLASAGIAEVLFIINIIVKIITQAKFRDDLLSVLEEATFPVLTGSFISVSFIIREIKKLFPPSENLDEQTEQLISRMLEKDISQEVIAYVSQVPIQKIKDYLNNNSSESNVQTDSDQTDLAISSQIIPEALPIVSKEKEKDSI